MQFRATSPWKLLVFVAAVLIIAMCALAEAENDNERGFVYVATNQPSGNAVVQFRRAEDGSLSPVNQVSTGGLGGTGNGVGNLDPLGSQDSLVLSDNGTLLLAVNAGSNEVSSLRAGRAGLRLLGKVSSGGVFPNSVALHRNLAYVLNAHGTANISGFRVSPGGVLQPIPGSTRALPSSSAAKPHDIRFSPDGSQVIVTDEGGNEIDVFDLDDQGVVSSVTTTQAAGAGPFGFTFARRGVLVVTEANSASVSSYFVGPTNSLAVISAAVPTTQRASCWITLTEGRSTGFVSNTASGTISSYRITGDGRLQLARAVAGLLNSGGAPIDSALSSEGNFLYVVDSALGRIVGFRVHGDSLTRVGATNGLPTTVQGIAVQ